MGAAQATDTPDRTGPTPSPRWVRPADGPPAPAELPVMPDAERELVLQGWNRTGKPYDTARLHEITEIRLGLSPFAAQGKPAG